MIEFEDWGLIDYNEAWLRQKSLASEITSKRNRNVLVFCEHPSVITVGRNGDLGSVVAKPDFLAKLGVDVVQVDRGGDATLHNPGQLVGYPIFNLLSLKEDLHWFLREIEQCIIDTVAHFGIKAGRVEGLTGVWVDGARKICAMGLHCSRWVTTHGFALNVTNNLNEFNYIIPCGLKNKGVTSIAMETGLTPDFEQVKKICRIQFAERFG
jgi:lipoyl(octanoyl) transferase